MVQFLKDGNGLYLSPVATSGYKGATCFFEGPYQDKFIPYVNVHNAELQKMKKTNGFNDAPLGFDNVQRLWYDNSDRIVAFDDVRAAAYVAQKFEENLEENLQAFYNGDCSVVPLPPENFLYPVDGKAARQVADARSRFHSRKNGIVVSRVTYDPQTALVKVFSDHKDKYKRPSLADMPVLRKNIIDLGPASNDEFLKAAEVVLEPFLVA